MKDAIKLTGLWANKSKDGKRYLAGNMSSTSRLLVMPNGFKQGERDPDYYAYLVPNQPKDQPKDQPKVDDIPF